MASHRDTKGGGFKVGRFLIDHFVLVVDNHRLPLLLDFAAQRHSVADWRLSNLYRLPENCRLVPASCRLCYDLCIQIARVEIELDHPDR